MPGATHSILAPEIIERARAGDRQALTTLLDHYHDRIHRMLVHLVGRSPELDDLRQEVLLAIVRGIPTFRGDSALSTWIGGICVNVARAHFRARRVRHERIVDDGQPAIERTPGVDAAAQLERRAELATVDRALAALSAEQRTAFVLATVYGYSVDEVAALMQAARSTTRLRLYYGRKKFQAALAKARRPRE